MSKIERIWNFEMYLPDLMLDLADTINEYWVGVVKAEVSECGTSATIEFEDGDRVVLCAHLDDCKSRGQDGER